MQSLTIKADTGLVALARHFHVRHFHESDDNAERDRLAALIHQDAEMTLVMTHFRPVKGRAAIMEKLYEERESVVYDATVDSHEWLGEDTLLVRGQVRYATEARGITQTTIWWIDEFRDRLFWRVQAFRNEAGAREAYSARRAADHL